MEYVSLAWQQHRTGILGVHKTVRASSQTGARWAEQDRSMSPRAMPHPVAVEALTFDSLLEHLIT